MDDGPKWYFTITFDDRTDLPGRVVDAPGRSTIITPRHYGGFMTRRSLMRPSVVLLVAVLLTVPASASDVERLATLARVWATVKVLHPFLLQKEIDWDGALVRAIPAVRAATTDAELARAVASMLAELGDPATRVVQNSPATRSSGEIALTRWAGDTLVVNAGPYAAAQGGMALWGEVGRVSKEVAKAKQVVLDVRHHAQAPEEQGAVAFALSQLSGLTDTVVSGPPSLFVHHSGYRPQQGTTSGGYYSGLLTVPGPTSSPGPAGTAPSRVVFVTDAESMLPSIAVALREVGKALIVADAPLGDHVVVNTRSIDLPGRWRAIVRLEQIGAEVAADAIAADPLAEALAIVEGRKAAPGPARRTGGTWTAPQPRWRPDDAYRTMSYPDVAHRLLAAFRIWSVIEYFYPYKALIGDWKTALTESIPQFIAADNEEEYARAVLQMVARVEDGHSGAYGHPALARILGAWRTPLEVREIEKEFVVTRLFEGVPAEVDVRVGDVVVSVDDEPFGARIARLRPYVTASTETARRNRLAAVALQGPPDSVAVLTLRGADGGTRTVRIPRRQTSPPRESGKPYRIIDGTIGYVDLTRLDVPQVDAMFEAFKGTTAIIFDMRGYPRGTGWIIAPRINTKWATIGAVFRRAMLSGVASFDESSSGFYFEQPLPASVKPIYTGLTVMLIDDRAISQAEHTGLFFEAASGTTFVGTPTAGANGDVTSFFLPGGFRVGFTGHDVRHADGRRLQRVGLQPHVLVAPTIAGIRAGRDEVLERALAFLKERPVARAVPRG
jgi:C-terminal processing protease CtpA/Prc